MSPSELHRSKTHLSLQRMLPQCLCFKISRADRPWDNKVCQCETPGKVMRPSFLFFPRWKIWNPMSAIMPWDVSIQQVQSDISGPRVLGSGQAKLKTLAVEPWKFVDSFCRFCFSRTDKHKDSRSQAVKKISTATNFARVRARRKRNLSGCTSAWMHDLVFM